MSGPNSPPNAIIIDQIPSGMGRCILLVIAHADDSVLFLGGTIAHWSRAGWRVVCVKVTDDRWDSYGLTESETILRNSAEFSAACLELGIAETVDLGYATDVLADACEVDLREKIIRLVRKHRPYSLVSFDPFAMYYEDNQDHIMVGNACNEAFWTSQFDLHHPEHLRDGLNPHGCFERWYFGRRLTQVTDVVDISSTLAKKIRAAQCHVTAMLNYAHQMILQAETGSRRIAIAERALSSGDPSELIEFMVSKSAHANGAQYGLEAVEEFRISRFGGLEALLND